MNDCHTPFFGGDPVADLVELLETHNGGCVVETTPGMFVDMTELKRCP